MLQHIFKKLYAMVSLHATRIYLFHSSFMFGNVLGHFSSIVIPYPFGLRDSLYKKLVPFEKVLHKSSGEHHWKLGVV